MFLAVNYHYIGEPDAYPHPGIYPLAPSRFRAQILLLARQFRFVSQQDLVAALLGERPLPPRAALVTFDDGLRCQYETALPILDALGVPAVYFASGLPYAGGKALSVHKTQWCRSHLAPSVFWEKVVGLHRTITGYGIDQAAGRISDEELRRQYPYDHSLEAARVKFILSRGVLPAEVQEAIVDGIFGELVPDEGAFCREFYMDREHLRELGRRGALGSHTYAHLPLPLLPPSAVEREIQRGVEALADISGVRSADISGISYPYGQTSLPIAAAARRAGFRYGFTIETSFNATLREPLLFARADTNDVPGGKDPKFVIAEGGDMVAEGGFALHRQLFFDERIAAA